jgi:hypothetical protein
MFNPRIYGAVRKKTFSEREKELCNYDKSTYYRVMGLTALTWLIIGLVWGFIFFSYKNVNAGILHENFPDFIICERNDSDIDVRQLYMPLSYYDHYHDTYVYIAQFSNNTVWTIIWNSDGTIETAGNHNADCNVDIDKVPRQYNFSDFGGSGENGENGGGGEVVIDYPYEYEDWLYVEMWKVYSLAVIGLGVVLSPFKLM